MQNLVLYVKFNVQWITPKDTVVSLIFPMWKGAAALFSRWWSNCHLFHGIDSSKGLRIVLLVVILGSWWKKVVVVTVVFTSFLREWLIDGTACLRSTSMQQQWTASRIVWRGEGNVRWTSLKTDGLQVLWLHESVGMGECSTIWMMYQVQPHPVNNPVNNHWGKG